jgi:hypothetical protein
MTKGMFELKPEELRAVIGGATYYSATNRLPTFAASAVLPATPMSTLAADRPATR